MCSSWKPSYGAVRKKADVPAARRSRHCVIFSMSCRICAVLLLLYAHLVMAALWNSAGHYIFALWFLLSSFFLLVFLAQSQRSQSGCLPYFYTWCGFSANLGCRSEMYCTRLAGNTGCKNDAKNRHLGTIAQLYLRN